jgi:hypothetical protein
MIASPELGNLQSWMEQTLVIASIGAVLPKLLRIQHPRTQVLYGQSVLVVCLLLPILQPWRHATTAVGNADFKVPPARAVTTAHPVQAPSGSPPDSRPSLHFKGAAEQVFPWIFGIGLAGRLGWLLVGLWQVRRYRIRAAPLYPIPEAVKAASALTHADALICLSDDACSPVTLGWLAPVVLLPGSALALSEEALCSVVCH